MTETTLLSICAGLILILLGIIGYFMARVFAKIDTTNEKVDSTNESVGKILVVSGITSAQAKIQQEQIAFLQAKQVDNAEEWKDLYKNYCLNDIKHK